MSFFSILNSIGLIFILFIKYSPGPNLNTSHIFVSTNRYKMRNYMGKVYNFAPSLKYLE